VGGTVDLDRGVRIYGEYGQGVHLDNAVIQKRRRFQGGIEVEGQPRWLGGRFAPYGALDVSSWREDDYDCNYALQVGLVTHRDLFNLRLGVEFVDGRPPLGEFFREDEQWVAAGVWVDF